MTTPSILKIMAPTLGQRPAWIAAWSDILRKEKRPEEEILQEHNMVGVRGKVEGIISHPLSISNLPQLRFYAIRQYIAYSPFEASIQPKDIVCI